MIVGFLHYLPELMRLRRNYSIVYKAIRQLCFIKEFKFIAPLLSQSDYNYA